MDTTTSLASDSTTASSDDTTTSNSDANTTEAPIQFPTTTNPDAEALPDDLGSIKSFLWLIVT